MRYSLGRTMGGEKRTGVESSHLEYGSHSVRWNNRRRTQFGPADPEKHGEKNKPEERENLIPVPTVD